MVICIFILAIIYIKWSFFFCFVTYNLLCQNHLFTKKAYSDAHIVITNLSESQDNKTAKNKNHLIVVAVDCIFFSQIMAIIT